MSVQELSAIFIIVLLVMNNFRCWMDKNIYKRYKNDYEELYESYEKLYYDWRTSSVKYDILFKDYNSLVDSYNKLLKEYKTTRNNPEPLDLETLSKKDIKSLISLCHPDKHNNSASSTRVTKILLDIKKQQQVKCSY